jgi:RNA polymerase sigma-70 factor (ECF subfamily)
MDEGFSFHYIHKMAGYSRSRSDNLYISFRIKLCCNLCRSYADADDLFQETWFKAIKNIEKYDDKKDFGKWLFTICINTYKNTQNCSENRKRVCFGSTEEKEIFLSTLPDTMVHNEKYEELIAVIRELPEKYRTVIALRYFNDYSEKDVSQILKIPVGTVKSRLSKAKQLIRRRFSI